MSANANHNSCLAIDNMLLKMKTVYVSHNLYLVAGTYLSNLKKKIRKGKNWYSLRSKITIGDLV
jgi:hypothetical protein